MTTPASVPQRSRAPWFAFAIAFAVAILFALYTQHVWEDFYITYRASKNFVTGNGLVYNQGERLHTFTSPFGVLFPAGASLLTLNSSDFGALWIFRIMSCVAFGGASALLWKILCPLPSKSEKYPAFMGFASAPGAIAVLWFIFDAKSVDFSINGMETAFMLLFLALTFWSLFQTGPRRWIVLGLSWSALMWTRPDSFVYIGFLAVGLWLFNEPLRTGLTRREWFPVFLRAGLLCSALYIPWLFATWAYYGSPVPFTILAKASVSVDKKTLMGLLLTVKDMLLHGTGTFPIGFLPSYFEFGGWPAWPLPVFRELGRICALLWILPFLRTECRVASFVFLGSQIYLSYFPNYPYPWYLPSSFFFTVVTVGGALSQVYAALRSSSYPWRSYAQAAVLLVSTTPVAIGGWYFVASARQLREQQRLVETGTRKAIGVWLKANASPRDTVFLEPLGYVGFFSDLKIYDYPGLSSTEVVDATRRLGSDWAILIGELRPEWLVLRPKEIERIQKSNTTLLIDSYAAVHTFSVMNQVRSLDIRGRAYLEHDAVFTVFRRNK